MRVALSLLVAFAFLAAFVTNGRADDKKKDKEVTLKGEVMCAKCELHMKGVKSCQTVLVVKKEGKDGKEGKEVTYFFKDKGSKEEYHEPVCGGGRKEATVKGTVTQKSGKRFITPSTVEYAKK